MKHLFTAFCMTMVVYSLSADKPEPKWEIETVEAEARESIQVKGHANIPYGTQQWLGGKEDIALILNARLKIEWVPDTFSQIRIKEDAIKFVDQDGNTYPLAGTVRSTNTFGWSSLDFNHGARPSEYNKPSPAHMYRPIFCVPATTRSGTFHFGERTADLTLSGVKPPLRAGDTLAVEVVSAQLLDQVKTVSDVRRKDFPSVLTNPNGKILQVTCNIEPQLDPEFGYSGVSYRTTELTIRTDKGIVVPTAGAVFREEIKTTSHNVGKESTVSDFVIYFAVPEGIESFEMLFHNDPISPSFSQISR